MASFLFCILCAFRSNPAHFNNPQVGFASLCVILPPPKYSRFIAGRTLLMFSSSPSLNYATFSSSPLSIATSMKLDLQFTSAPASRGSVASGVTMSNSSNAPQTSALAMLSGGASKYSGVRLERREFLLDYYNGHCDSLCLVALRTTGHSIPAPLRIPHKFNVRDLWGISSAL